MPDDPTAPTGGSDPAGTRSTSSTPGSVPAPATIPSRIGHYAILRVLGEGGMGTVYEARQEQPKRTVALKVIRSGYLSPQLLRRFEHESQVLARLQHPGIAQVYEAGTVQDESGRPVPFFAMEFIRGIPLTQYAESKALGTSERLDLVARICDAVYHAHQKGVIHRDLKPSNILVDESGQPKVLDFGVARATDSDVQQTTLQTDIGQLIGTVPYMSPEQVSGDPDQLDTRSDVYALGVLAYELLAGRLPYDLQRKMIHEAVRVIREEEPTSLSRINRALRGDVETIVAKALEKDKSRRYQSAESLASDIRRYLKDEPIAARPASTWYQLQKFSRRNRGLVAGVSAAFVLLIAGVTATGLALRRALDAETGLTNQLAQTRKARTRAEKINTFVTDSLQSSDPFEGGKTDTTIAAAMVNAEKEIEKGAFRGDPETDADMRGTVGRILHNNGQYPRAEALLSSALAIRESTLGAQHPDVARALTYLSAAMYKQGRYAEAEPLLVRALAIQESALSADDLEVARTINSLAEIHRAQGRYDRAEPLLMRALEIREKALGPDHADVATSANDLAKVYFALGRYALAQTLLERALAIREKALGPEHPAVATTMSNLAETCSAMGQRARAEPLLNRALEIRERSLGPDHPDVAQNLNNLGLFYRDQGLPDRAEPLYVRALQIFEKALGPDHTHVARTLNNLADIYEATGQYARAEPLYTRALEINEKALGPDHPEVASILNNLASLYDTMGQPARAEPLFVRTLKIQETSLGPDHPDVAMTASNLAALYAAQGQASQAEPLYVRALAAFETSLGPDHPHVASSATNLGVFYHRQGQSARAVPLFTRALMIREKVLGPDHPSVMSSLVNLAEVYEKLGQYDRAQPLWERVLAARQASLPPGDWRIANTRSRLGGSFLGQRKFIEAQGHLVEGFEGLDAAKDTPRKPADRLREACDRVVSLYESWDKEEPGKGYDAKSAEWKVKLEALSKPVDPPPPDGK